MKTFGELFCIYKKPPFCLCYNCYGEMCITLSKIRGHGHECDACRIGKREKGLEKCGYHKDWIKMVMK